MDDPAERDWITMIIVHRHRRRYRKPQEQFIVLADRISG